MTKRYRFGGAWGSVLAALAALALLGPTPLTAQEGTVTGLIVASTTNQPINGAQVSLEGTDLGALTNARGRFLITRVPAGTYNVQVVYVGYRTATESVTVTAGGTGSVEFRLEVSAVALDEIVVTGTA